MDNKFIKKYCSIIWAVVILVSFAFSNFVPDPSIETYIHLTAISFAAVITIYLVLSLKKSTQEEKDKSIFNIFTKNKFVRMFMYLIISIMTSIFFVNQGIPWLYTEAFGKNEVVYAKVTGWESSNSKHCHRPIVNNLENYSLGSRALCVNKEDRNKYSTGTSVRLSGKKSGLGINVKSIEAEYGS